MYLDNHALLLILERMDVSGVATMYLVNTRFRDLIRGNSHVFLNKPIASYPVHLDVHRQSPRELYHFFMIFGDQISALIIDDLCMDVAMNIVGYSQQLRMLACQKANLLALDFLKSNMPRQLSVFLVN